MSAEDPREGDVPEARASHEEDARLPPAERSEQIARLMMVAAPFLIASLIFIALRLLL